MALKAGFAEIDITPPMGTQKIGMLKLYEAQEVLDPLFARCAVFECGGEAIGFVQLDTLFITPEDTADFRRRISEAHGFDGSRVMIACTHTHAGPAVADCGETPRDAAYVESLAEAVARAFGEALAARRTAEIGFGHTNEFGISFNRRTVMRDGSAKTQWPFSDPEALYLEGPIDPEVAVIAARDKSGRLLGALVNFACHPTHHGDGGGISAGFPGALAAQMKRRKCPVTMFFNGASGNIHFRDFTERVPTPTAEQMGAALADDVRRVLKGMSWRGSVRLATASRMTRLPFRKVFGADINGTARSLQRYGSPGVYDGMIAKLLKHIERLGTQPAEVQAHAIDEVVVVGIPAEIFVQYGLRIKQGAHPRHALIFDLANGHVGYVPTREALERGGYETGFGPSRLGPEAGDMLSACALEVIRQTQS